MSEKCPRCDCQLDLGEGEATDCCCGRRIQRDGGRLVDIGAASRSG